MIPLTLRECQQSPCFLCRHMDTTLDGSRLESHGVLARCRKGSERFPEAQCELYTEEKLEEDARGKDSAD